LQASFTAIRELPTAWCEFLADQRPRSDVFRQLENGRFRHGLLRATTTQALLEQERLRSDNLTLEALIQPRSLTAEQQRGTPGIPLKLAAPA
jgi:hypothetical protein